MSRRTINLIVILVLLAAAIFIDVNQQIQVGNWTKSLKTVLGLDLQGGMQVLLEVDLPADTAVSAQSLDDARRILENRSNALGVSESPFQVAGTRRILGEFPGLTNTEEVLAVLKETGQLEFVDMGDTPLSEGTVIKTDIASSKSGSSVITPTVAPTATITATVAATQTGTPQPTASPQPTATTLPTEKIWHTVMTGDQLKTVGVGTNTLGQYVVNFELKTDAQKIFSDYTSNNIGKYLVIVLDKKIISAPKIQNAITEGKGEITGNFTVDTANNLAVQLRYGALPVPLKVVESRVIGPTLGQDSLNKSMIAGLVGFIIVTLFMVLYYRLPGAIAILAIITYAAITLAIYKLLAVTLTLPGIAGLLLSTGGALDANILMFERLKEELHSGRSLAQAIELGWKRAWPSIRDSNVATLLTSLVLFVFGSNYGATIVKGFAITLGLGVLISLFSAIVTSRTFLSIILDQINPADHEKWIGA